MGGVILSFAAQICYMNLFGVDNIYYESSKYLATHSPFSILFECIVGFCLFYSCKNEKTLYCIGFSIVIIGFLANVFQGVFQINRLIITALFAGLLYFVVKIRIPDFIVKNKIINVLDEYSFSIYLGHTTVIFIVTQAQKILGFNDIVHGLMDVVIGFILVIFLHKVVECKLSAMLLKKIV